MGCNHQVNNPTEEAVVVIHLLPGKASRNLDRTQWGFNCHHVVEGQLRCGNMAKAFGEVQIVITRLPEDKEEQERSVSQSHEVDLPGTEFGSQWLIEPPYKPPLLHRQKTWHLRLSCRRRHFVGLREDLAEDVDRGKDDDRRKIGIVAGLIEQFPSFLDLRRRQGDEV